MWMLPLSSMRTLTFSNFWFVTPSIFTPLRYTEPAAAVAETPSIKRTVAQRISLKALPQTPEARENFKGWIWADLLMGTRGSTFPTTVLIVDDEPTIIDVLTV